MLIELNCVQGFRAYSCEHFIMEINPHGSKSEQNQSRVSSFGLFLKEAPESTALRRKEALHQGIVPCLYHAPLDMRNKVPFSRNNTISITGQPRPFLFERKKMKAHLHKMLIYFNTMMRKESCFVRPTISHKTLPSFQRWRSVSSHLNT